jgi:hypothetical protein
MWNQCSGTNDQCCLYESIKVSKKIGISKSLWDQPKGVLQTLMGFLLCYLGLPDKREREKCVCEL